MSLAGALRVELRPDDLESPALTFTLHPNMEESEKSIHFSLSIYIIQYFFIKINYDTS